MDFDNFVKQPQIVDIRIQHQLDEAERLKALCERATAVFEDEKVQRSHSNQREFWLAAYIDSKSKVTDLMEKYDRVTEEVRDWLYKNLPFTAASLLEFRYCDGLKNKEIAQQLNHKEQSVKNQISRAIREARKIYNEQQKGDTENGTPENTL